MARTGKMKKDDGKDLKEVAKQVAREAILEFNDQNDDEGPDDETLSFIDSSNGITEERKDNDPTGFDIFSDVGEPRTEKGDIIRYVIRKWGQHIATKFHPYSWEELHEEYGSGNYQVIARSDSTKKFVKSESRILGDARSANRKQNTETREETVAPPHQQPQGLGFMELFTLLQEQQKQAKEEAREVSREAQNTQNQMMILVAELLKTNSTSGVSSSVQMMQMITQMIQQQQQTTNQMFEKMAENQVKMFEKINERIEKVADKKSSEFEMLNKGFEMFSKMNDLAEKKAQFQLELLEEAKADAKSDDDSSPRKKSLTDSLIEGILPVVSQALVAQQQGPALVAHKHQLALQQQAIQRRQLQVAQARRAKADRQLQTGSGVKTVGNANTTPTLQTTTKSEVKTSVTPGGATVRTNIVKNSGLPSLAIGQKEDVDVLELESQSNNLTELTVREKCQKLLPEFLGKLMLENVPSDVAAGQTLEMLKNQGISREDFLKEVQVDDLLAVAEEYGLPEVAFEWLNDLYAHIQSKSRNVVRRKARSGEQPTA
jgi:hypothetical protein